MRIRLILCAAATAVAGFTVMQPVESHHAFGSEFDANAPVLLKGKIAKIEWINPHTWIHVDVTTADGAKETWMVEGGSPNTLLRRGANKNMFPEGTEVVVDGYQARDHNEKRANARNVTFPDGRKLFLGSTGTGAPDENQFPTGNKVTNPSEKPQTDKDKEKEKDKV